MGSRASIWAFAYGGSTTGVVGGRASPSTMEPSSVAASRAELPDPSKWNQRCPPDATGRLSQASAGQRHQILLQWIDAEDVGDRVHLKIAAIATEEFRGDAVMSDMAAVESAEHTCLGSWLHRQVVVGSTPGLVLRGVAPGAGIRPGPSLGLSLPGNRRVGGGCGDEKESATSGVTPADRAQATRKSGTRPQPARPAFRSGRCAIRAS